MSWSYDPLLATAKDRVRHSIGDTDATNPLRQDETIAAAISSDGEAMATAILAEGLAAQYAQEPDSFGSVGLSVSWRERVKTWLALAERSRAIASATEATTIGVSVMTRDDLTTSEYVRPEWWTP
jgi:hypothetical protein